MFDGDDDDDDDGVTDVGDDCDEYYVVRQRQARKPKHHEFKKTIPK
jgi:hypothetical protein